MRVAIVGAGIAGVTTAYELGADGHEVTLFERQGNVATEGSFAHAGLSTLAPFAPWSAPGMPLVRWRALQGVLSSVRWLAGLDGRALARIWRGRQPGGGAAAPDSPVQQLAAYSRERRHELARHLRLDYEQSRGHLVLLRSSRDVARARAALRQLAEFGQRFHLVDAARCHELEPGLAAETPLQAGIHMPDDEVGNCRQFAHLLRQEAQRLGVQFQFDAQVVRITPGRPAQLVWRPRTRDAGTEPTPEHQGTFDAVVVCAAAESAALLTPLGLRLPLRSVHGCSITAPLRQLEAHPDIGPRSALTDARHHVMISRIGTRLRVSGGARPRPANDAGSERDFALLFKVLHDWYPGAARLADVQRWRGTRALLPDAAPVLGASGLQGIWLNLAHGSNGWAWACGSARLVADALAERPPSITTAGLTVNRLSRRTLP